MSARYIFVIVGVAVFLAGIVAVVTLVMKTMSETSNETPVAKQPVKTNMQLTSLSFAHDSLIPAKYTCDGENINPPLAISNVPSGARSLVLIVDDPDAPAGDWVHWTVWNIAPETLEIAENSIPVGATLGMTDFDSIGYGGPCPPFGTHGYQFKLYALDMELDIGGESNKSDIEKIMQGHVLDQALLVGRYSRIK